MTVYFVRDNHINSQSGQMGAAFQTVYLVGTMTHNSILLEPSNQPFYIKKLFENEGIGVVSCKVEKQILFTNKLNIVLGLNVLNASSPENVRRTATSLLSNFTYDSVLGNGDRDRVFSNVSLRVGAGNTSSGGGVKAGSSATIKPPQNSTTKANTTGKTEDVGNSGTPTSEPANNQVGNNPQPGVSPYIQPEDDSSSMTLIFVGLLALIILKR